MRLDSPEHKKSLMTEHGVGRFGDDILLVVDLNNELMDYALLDSQWQACTKFFRLALCAPTHRYVFKMAGSFVFPNYLKKRKDHEN